MSFRIALPALFSLLFLTGCSLFQPAVRITTEPESYALAERHMDQGNYNLAIDQLTGMENRFPFGNYAAQVQLDLIHAEYEQSQYAAALRRANRFIRLQPAHPRIDSVYYLRGLTQFTMADQTANVLGTRNPIDRDVSGYQDAFASLNQFVQRYPESDHLADGKALMQVARTRLALHNLNIAQYYYQVEEYGAALTRLDKALSEFPGEPSMERALALKARAHEALSEPEKAAAALDLLQKTYPDSDYIENDQLIADFRFHRPWYFWATLGLIG